MTSVLYKAARTHLLHTHPSLHSGSPDPISLHITFLRRTNIGPATLRVQDTKLGSRTSTLHITLSQQDSDDNTRDEVAGYITVSNISIEDGPTMRTGYEIVPPPVHGGTGALVDLDKLARTGADGAWKNYEVAFSSMRRASRHIEFFSPSDPTRVRRGFVEQWVRFKPYGTVERWTNDTLGFLIDMFPMMLETFDEKPWEQQQKETGKIENGKRGKEEELSPRGKFWYPTVLLNVDFKKNLPAEGVEWLYSRVQTKVLRNGRMDLDIVVLDRAGEVVALSNHVALIVSAERNLSARKSNGNGNGDGSKSKM